VAGSGTCSLEPATALTFYLAFHLRSKKGNSVNEQKPANAVRQFGKLRVWVPLRGYGFIDSEMSNGTSFFLHISQIKESQRAALIPGVFLEFNPLKTDKGWSAMAATLVE
jgi:cold shock CspA family protein